jgi:hypothetical protein
MFLAGASQVEACIRKEVKSLLARTRRPENSVEVNALET